MQVAVLLSNSILTSLFVILCVTNKSDTTPCDTTWIRLVYMLSCGKKKRESIPSRNESFSEPLPFDLNEAIDYFRVRDPTNPLFNEDVKLLNEILEGDENEFRKEKSKYRRFSLFPSRHSRKIARKKLPKGSVFMKKLFDSTQENRLGIPGFPNQWNVIELVEQKTNENYRREIDRLLEECCKTAQESSCNGDTFRGACK